MPHGQMLHLSSMCYRISIIVEALNTLLRTAMLTEQIFYVIFPCLIDIPRNPLDSSDGWTRQFLFCLVQKPPLGCIGSTPSNVICEYLYDIGLQCSADQNAEVIRSMRVNLGHIFILNRETWIEHTPIEHTQMPIELVKYLANVFKIPQDRSQPQGAKEYP